MLLRRASSKRFARSLRLRFWNVSVSTWSWKSNAHKSARDLLFSGGKFYLKMKKTHTWSESLIFSNSSSRDFFCCSWAIFRSFKRHNILLSQTEEYAQEKFLKVLLTLYCPCMLLLQSVQSVIVGCLHLCQGCLMILCHLLKLQRKCWNIFQFCFQQKVLHFQFSCQIIKILSKWRH